MKLKFLLIAYIIGAIFLLSILFINTMQYNTLSEKFENKKIVFSLFPQGWAFFTRNPREGQVILYQKNNGKFVEVPFKHNNYRYAFGLNRTCTKVYTELGYIRKNINDSSFKAIEWNYQEKIFTNKLDNLETITLQNPLKNGILNGKYLLVIQEPIPWAWSKNAKRIKMPALAVFLNIKN